MGLLNEKCRLRLSAELKKTLPDLRVEKNYYLEPFSRAMLVLLDNTLPKTGKLRGEIESHVDHYPLSTFVADQLSIKFQEEREYIPEGESKKLSELYTSTELTSLAESLISDFDLLPKRYKITLPLPKHIGKIFDFPLRDFRVGESIIISPVTEYFLSTVPRNSKNELLQKRLRLNDGLFSIFKKEAEWDLSSIYIQIDTTGYLDSYGTSAPAKRALDALKSFFGLAIACKIILKNPSFARKPKKITAVFHEVDISGNLDVEGEYIFPEAFSGVLNDLDSVSFKADYDNPEFIENYVREKLQLIGRAFRDDPIGERILTASRWYFEAFSRHDETLQFVQLVIVLEVLVGDRTDSSELGLGALYKNRIAYMLASSSEERSEMMKKIGQIYSMRSKIVHNGKHSFSPSERVNVRYLRDLLGQLFSHELGLLKADNKSVLNLSFDLHNPTP